MAEQVSYEMNLNDLVSGKLDNAEKHAQKFETRMGSVHSALGHLGEKIIQVGEYMGIYLAFEKLAEFAKKGTEMVHEQDISIGQLENTLKNVGERAGLSSEQLVSMAEKMEHKIPFTTAAIVDMENALSRFGNMSPVVYQKVLTMSADISVALKRNGADVANTLGRIMEKPAENGRLLRQLNITLTAEERKYLMQLEKTGQVAKAQTFIFQELATKGYGGAAEAAANSDPLFRYNKVMYDLQIEIGKVGIAFEEHMAPALEEVATAAKEGIAWIKQNKDTLITVGQVVGVAAGAYLSYAAVVKGTAIYELARAEGMGVVTAAQWALNAAMNANPIGLIVAGVAALVGGLILAYKHSVVFRAILSGIMEVGREMVPIFKGLGDVIVGAFTLDPAQIKKGFSEVTQGIKDFSLTGALKKGIQSSLDADKADALAEKHQSTIGKQVDKKAKTPILPGTIGGKQTASSKATGSKVLNINIHIGALVKELKIQTTNFKEGVGKAQDMVTNALLSAVNDSQMATDL